MNEVKSKKIWPVTAEEEYWRHYLCRWCHFIVISRHMRLCTVTWFPGTCSFVHLNYFRLPFLVHVLYGPFTISRAHICIYKMALKFCRHHCFGKRRHFMKPSGTACVKWVTLCKRDLCSGLPMWPWEIDTAFFLMPDTSVWQTLVFQRTTALAVIKLNAGQEGYRKCLRSWELFVACIRDVIWKRV